GDDGVADAPERDMQLLALAALLALRPQGLLGAGLGGLAGGLLLEQAAGVLLGPSLFRQVPGDLQKPPDRAGLVAQGGEDDVGPEARAVLAQPPAFLLVLAGGGGLQLPRRLAGGHVLRRVEAGQVLADDLLRGV